MLEGVEEFTTKEVKMDNKPEVSEYEKMMWLKSELTKLKDAFKGISIDSVSVDNLDEIRSYLRDEINRLVDKLQIMADKMAITNQHLQNLKYEVKIPESIKFSDFENLQTEIKTLSDILNKKEFSPEINVRVPEIKSPEVNIPEIKLPPINIPEAKVEVDLKEIDLTPLIKALKPLGLISDKASKPISVRLSDGVRFIQALKAVADKSEKVAYAFSTNAGMTSDEFKAAYKGMQAANTITSNRKAVAAAGTAERLVASSTPCIKVILSADLGNTNPVVVGGADVVAAAGSQKGIVLIPANDPVTIEIDDVYKLYVDSQTNGDAVVFNYYKY